MERTTRDYLRLPPWEALLEIVNDTHNLVLSPHTTTLRNMEVVDTETVEVTLSVNRSTSHRQLLPPFDEHVFQYQRLDLTRFFRVNTPVTVPDVPLTTKDLVRVLTDRTGVVFDINDFRHQSLDGVTPPYTLKAHPRSLRWVGQLKFTWG